MSDIYKTVEGKALGWWAQTVTKKVLVIGLIAAFCVGALVSRLA